ncbi:hypothetical protein [Xenococcus sp. PCC 7305]|uniref:hypothetical protein n=1 Tax=Xenococcus sp. PCC 7305 TaxID=102125 RepID=UPI000594696E|nr:hypothetical protein [Xenococcus sp. PCC 7305]
MKTRKIIAISMLALFMNFGIQKSTKAIPLQWIKMGIEVLGIATSIWVITQDKSLANQEKTEDSMARYFPIESFPRQSCGDPLPSDSSMYPIEYKAVSVPYSSSNLSTIKAKYCSDALPVLRKSDNQKVIQVASFYDMEKAGVFSQFLANKYGKAYLSNEPTIVKKP